MDLDRYLREESRAVDAALRRFLPPAGSRPATLQKAMRYSLFAGGKRLRPVLCLAAAEACGGAREEALPLACAVECIHTYSLIHDDLPCMDDDDLRRGRPTSHKVFGEGVAVLAGDALLTFAFELAARCRAWPRYSHADVVRDLAVASGSLHLIAGQVADLEGEGRKLTLRELQFIHERKTAALLRCSIRLGAMSANASPAALKALTDFGSALGVAFQVVDDILDVTQTSEQLGKSAGKDAAAQKATYPALLGLDGARKAAARWTKRALDALRPFGPRAVILRALTERMLIRQS